MGDETNWRTQVTAQDFFGQQKKTLQVANRRPLIRQASDLVGPGIGSSATMITDWNDELATFNGYYSSGNAGNLATGVGALHGPIPDAGHGNKDFHPYVGFVTMDSLLGGQQILYPVPVLASPIVTSTAYWTRSFVRNPADPTTVSSIQWGPWVFVQPGLAPGVDYKAGTPTSTAITSGSIVLGRASGARLHGSGFTTCYVGSTGVLVAITLTITGVGTYSFGEQFFNEASSHKSVPCDVLVTGITPGTYTYSVQFSTTVSVDSNDFYKFSLIEV